MAKVNIPTYDALMNPLIQALNNLGGSGTIEEINNKVAEIAGITDEQLDVLHDPNKGGSTQFEYRLAWSRTYLKRYGVLENSGRGVWALTPTGSKVGQINDKEVVRLVREQLKNEQGGKVENHRLKLHGAIISWNACSKCHRMVLKDLFNGYCGNQASPRSK